jgi:hypothetical protein
LKVSLAFGEKKIVKKHDNEGEEEGEGGEGEEN